MSEDTKQPADEPKKDEAAGEEAAPMNRAERRARKHKRKGELRELHDRGGSQKKDSKAHTERMHRRKAI